MNVLLFKRDLDHFSNSDILAISKMYDLSGDVNDLRWLIAIKHSQKTQMLPFGEYEQALILENLDDDALENMCQIKGYGDLCEEEYKRRLAERYPNIRIQGTIRNTFKRSRKLEPVKIWLDGLGLEHTIEELDNLKILNLQRKELAELPEFISELKNLQKLYLGNNQLRVLPEFIGKLKNLELLDISNNQLIELPNSISQLSKLLYFGLDSNQLEELPDSIGGLKNLTELALDNNRLTKLPESIGNLDSLESLFLQNNPLQNLPDSIEKLKKLEELDLGPTSVDVDSLRKKLPNAEILAL